jgi:hypothetical protein
VSRLCFLQQIRHLVPPFPPVDTVAAPFGSPAVLHLHRYYGVVRLLFHPSSAASGFPWRSSYRSCERRWRALLGLWEIPLETCPELGTPAIPGRPSQLRSYPDAAFRSTNGVGIATIKDFGAEPSRPASLLCTLRTHQSPGEWQHSLPACSLALAGRDLHPLDFIKWFHLLHYWFLLFHAFPSAMAVLVIHLIATLARLLGPEYSRPEL